jgi:hypothetical protein
LSLSFNIKLSKLIFKQGYPVLIQTKVAMQLIKVKHKYDSLLNIMALISYVKIDTRQSVTHIQESQQFESMYTLQGRIRSTYHTLFTLDSHRVPNYTSHVVHVGNLSQVPTRTKHASTPERSLGNQRQTDLTVVLGHLILPPSRQPWSRGERFQPIGYTATSPYWAHNTSM